MSLFKELKRRNVIRVAIAYLVIGWLLAQVSATLEQAMHMPEWFDTMVVSLLLIGFPIALFFSWAFELTPEGIKKEEDVIRDDSITNITAQKLDIVTIAALIIVGILVLWQQFSPNEGDSRQHRNDETSVGIDNVDVVKQPSMSKEDDMDSSKDNIEEAKNNTIAVLPFTDMSPKKDQEYFSDGITEEILNVLAKIPELQITSRTSAFSFKDTKSDLKTIANKLGVANILEGSVRKSGTTVRITAQLIDTKTDKHLWSETYDRELTDIFKVQDEISAAIVKALRETMGLSITNPEAIAKVINPEAYDHYLRGLQQQHVNTFDSLKDAVMSSNAALNIEPDFSLAKIALANSLLRQINTGIVNNPDFIEQAEKLAHEVLELEPDLTQAYMTLANVYQIKGQNDKRIQALDKAYQIDPNNAKIIVNYVRAHKNTINAKQSTLLFDKAQQLDPLNAEIPYFIGLYYRFNPKERHQAEMYYKRAIELNPNNGDYTFMLGQLYAESFADIPKAIEQFKILQNLDPNDPDSPIYLSRAYTSLGDADKAITYANKALQINPLSAEAFFCKTLALVLKGDNQAALDVNDEVNASDNIFYRKTRDIRLDYGLLWVHLLLKRKDYQKVQFLVDAFVPGTTDLINTPAPQAINEIGNPLAISILSTTYRAEGKDQLADKIAQRLRLLSPKDKIQQDLYNQAMILTALNKKDEASDYLSTYIDDGNRLNWRSKILYNPIFLQLHDHQRYQALINRIEAEMGHQKQIVDKIDIEETNMKDNL